MKLAPVSVPYRVLQKTASLVVTVVIIASFGAGIQLGSLWLFAAIGAIILGTLGYEFAYYRRFRYELTDDTFDLQSGVFSRREREIPYGRIQNVDTTRNIVQRLAGISAVNIETAGGGSTEAVIQYVSAAEAERLQQEIRYRKRDMTERETAAGTDADTADSEEEAAERDTDRRRDVEETTLFEISPSELALAGVLSFDPRVPGLLLAVFTGSIPFVSPIIPTGGSTAILVAVLGILLVGAIVLAWVVGAVSAIINYWGFRLTRSGDELRYERGLLQRYSGTIPFDKIQATTIEDNPLKRQVGYATLAVETAGYAPGQAGGRGSEAAVPIASLDRVESLAREIDPYGTPTLTRPPKRIRRRYLARYLITLGVVTAVLYAITLGFDAAAGIPWYLPAVGVIFAPIAAHYKWLHRGYWLGENHLVTRNGFWNRETKLVAYYRIQTVLDTRTVFQRRWNVATVIADTAGSLSILGQECAAVDIDDADAVELREALTERLNEALTDRRAIRERKQRKRAFERSDETGSESEIDAEADDKSNDDIDAEADDKSNDDIDAETGGKVSREVDDDTENTAERDAHQSEGHADENANSDTNADETVDKNADNPDETTDGR